MRRWAEVHNEEFNDDAHDIPLPEDVTIGKLGGEGLMSDNCNTAQKEKRLLNEEVEKANADGKRASEDDCQHHLRNTWFGGGIKALSKHITAFLKDHIDKIDSRLRIGSLSMEVVIRTSHKEFSLTKKYPKGHGEIFQGFMNEYHPGALLFHCERVSGSRQDIAVEGACAVFWNRPYWVEFLDERLRMMGPSDGNILQENLFVILSSTPMIGLFRVCSILHLSVCIPMRWLAGKTHTLKELNWSVRSMGRVIDTLEVAMESIVRSNGALVLDEDFMMSIFSVYKTELPPFNEYLIYQFENKTQKLVGSSILSEVPYSELRKELFSPTRKENIDSSEYAEELGSVFAKAMLKELRDPTKATSKYLSSLDGSYSWKNTSPEVHKSLMGKMATNDVSEKNFATGTHELQVYGTINLDRAMAIGVSKCNNDVGRKLNIGKKTKESTTDGLLHQLPPRMQTSLIITCMKDSLSTKQYNSDALWEQRKARKLKDELAKEKSLEKASEEHVEAYYYHKMYHFPACWRSEEEVDTELEKIKTKADKLYAVKENILIRVKGFGWKEFAHPWSKNGVQYTPNQLAAHLKTIIQSEKTRTIPRKPPFFVPKRKVLPQLGQLTADVQAMDEWHLSNVEHLEENARTMIHNREAVGMGDVHSELQPRSMPIVSELLGERIDVLSNFDLDTGGTELRWCQGKVTEISDGTNLLRPGARSRCYDKEKAVVVLWDAIPELNWKQQEMVQELLPSKWNKHVVGGWRYDFGNIYSEL